MSEQEKEMTKNLSFALRRNQAKVSLSTVSKTKKYFFFYRKRSLIKERKEGFLIGLATVIKKDLTTSIRNNADELKVQKTRKTQ